MMLDMSVHILVELLLAEAALSEPKRGAVK